MLSHLIASLERKFPDLTPEELAEILWLTVQQWQNDSSEERGSIEPDEQAEGSKRSEIKQNASDSAPLMPPTYDRRTSVLKRSSQQSMAGVTTAQASKGSKTTECNPTPEAMLAIPDAPALRQSFELLRAMRPLTRLVPSATADCLDISSTVKAIAETQIWSFQMQPVLEPWLELALVVDVSPSMVIWQRVVLNLRRTLAQSGVFRDVRIWSLEATEQAIVLRSGFGPQRVQSFTYKPRELLDPSRRRLVLVVSDCIASYWEAQPLRDALQVWSQAGPLGLVQMLPESLWGRTSLVTVHKGLLASGFPGQPSQTLQFVKRGLQRRKAPIGVKVPVLTLEPRVAELWSQMVAGQGNILAPGIVFGDVKVRVLASNSGQVISELKPEERLSRFQNFASPMARQLAGLLAGCPEISLPIIRIVQAALLEKSQQVHVAEVLLGGLFKPQKITAHTPADTVQYVFYEGVRSLIQDAVPSDKLFTALSVWLNNQFGFSLVEFQAQITTERLSEVKPFAGVMLDVLRRKGGEYAEILEAIEQNCQKHNVQDKDSGKVTDTQQPGWSWQDFVELDQLDFSDVDPILQSAYLGGFENLPENFGSLQNSQDVETLYEAKLILIGEGNVGKTTLLKALAGKAPQAGEQTTHGISIDIQALHFPHPDKPNTQIKFNLLDFGGQEVYRVTHQFFFSKRAVYLLLWEPRRGVQQCQVEDWLNMLRLRVGEDARVIIVSTHCQTGERIARIDKPVLKSDYGDIIVNFLEVDSLVDDRDTGEKVGIAALKQQIAHTAKTFDQMGAKLNRAWRESRDELLAMEAPRITYIEFATCCDRHGLSAIATRILADLMHDLGYIVYFSNDEFLRNDVVLQPEWLTKAIGFVLEDRTTQEMDGILPDSRLKEVWHDHPFTNEPRYSPELYPFFLRLMEKYDVSYRLEDGTASLVSQHVPQVRPNLPWLPEEEPERDRRRIAMVCVMEESPPGLIPWMIVRTHDYIYKRHENDGKEHRLHWQKGMFLRNRGHGEAMLELRDRELHLYVEAVWPEYFTNILQQTLQTLIDDTWPGLKDRYYFAVPCPSQKNSRACIGRFEINTLHQFLEEGDTYCRCQFCRTRHEIVDLLYGFEEKDTREQLSRIETKVDRGFTEIQDNLAEWESRIANYVMDIMRMLADEAKSGPRLFTLEPVDGNWRRLFDKRYRLHLWCEAPNCQHRVHQPDMGVYEFDVSREWVTKVAPYANLVARVLKTALPVAVPAANLYFGEAIMDSWNIQQSLEAMKEATGGLLDEKFSIAEPRYLEPGRFKDGLLTEAERSGILALHEFLREQDPHHQRLGLKRMPTYTGDYLWLCETHYQAAQPKIPDRIE